MLTEEECQAIMQTVLEAVHEEISVPLLMALGTLTAELSKDPERGKLISAELARQAQSCPDDLMGRRYLEALAAVAESGATDPLNALRVFGPVRKIH